MAMVDTFICADCGKYATTEEILQTQVGRVCESCFNLMVTKAAANREKFGYKFKKFLKKFGIVV